MIWVSLFLEPRSIALVLEMLIRIRLVEHQSDMFSSSVFIIENRVSIEGDC